MSYMFKGCSSLKKVDLSKFETKNVIDMKFMFSQCLALEQLNIENFNIDNLNDMSYMFNKCNSLTDLEIPNISRDIDVNYMLSDCKEILKSKMSRYNLDSNAFKNVSEDIPVEYDYEDRIIK